MTNTHQPRTTIPNPPLTRAEALDIAIGHVTKVATNTRGFMDGASFRERAEFAERYARFLMGGDE